MYCFFLIFFFCKYTIAIWKKYELYMFSKLIQMYVCVRTSTIFMRSVFSDRSILTSFLQTQKYGLSFFCGRPITALITTPNDVYTIVVLRGSRYIWQLARNCKYIIYLYMTGLISHWIVSTKIWIFVDNWYNKYWYLYIVWLTI